MDASAHPDGWTGSIAERFAEGHYRSLRGRVRTRVIHRHLTDHLPPPPLRVVDIGGGAGHQSLPLARRGDEVTIVDPSDDMLRRAEDRVRGEPADVAGRVRLVRSTGEAAPEVLRGLAFGPPPESLSGQTGRPVVLDTTKPVATHPRAPRGFEPVELDTGAAEVAAVAARRTTQLIAALRRSGIAFDGRSLLPGWSRLTVVCHLRYGATALLRMSCDALAGRETAFYPTGRARQRASTLVPGPGEAPEEVLDDWADAAARLDRLWAGLDEDAWRVTVAEPAGNRDLGALPLAGLALARLTEVDVHAVDLDVGFPDWSTTLVDVALPARLARLPVQRTNHRDVDRRVQGTWLLAAGDLRWVVTVDGDRVGARPAVTGDEQLARATITGTRRDLLALLLGRPRRQPLRVGGDRDFGAAFERAFPGP